MIDFPCAKINLGLNIVEKRNDGYHNLQTVFLPVQLCDALEIKTMSEQFPSDTNCNLKISGDGICCNEADNLVVKAYNLLAADYEIPRIQAGLGGGSSDAAFMLKLLDQRFRINAGNAELEKYAARLGADCPFFINAEPAYAEGIGEILSPVEITDNTLSGYTLVIVKPQVSVSTKEAFAGITPRMPEVSCREIVAMPIEQWKGLLTNDFEESVFAQYPELQDIKDKLYEAGAAYAQMSGSGSSIFGIFKTTPDNDSIQNSFSGSKIYTISL